MRVTARYPHPLTATNLAQNLADHRPNRFKCRWRDDIYVRTILAVNLQLSHPRSPGHQRIGLTRFLGDKQRRLTVKLCAMCSGEQTYRLGVVTFDGGKQFAGSLPLLCGKEGFTFAINLGQYSRIKTVSLFFRPVLRFRWPGIQQAEERHFFALLTQTRGNTLCQRTAQRIT